VRLLWLYATVIVLEAPKSRRRQAVTVPMRGLVADSPVLRGTSAGLCWRTSVRGAIVAGMAYSRNERWGEHFSALQQYTSRVGTSMTPTTHVELFGGKMIAIGAWVAYNRQRQRAGTLSREREQALSALAGWKWDRQQPGRRYDKGRDVVILERYSQGVSAKKLADEFGLSRQRVHQIVKHKVSQ